MWEKDAYGLAVWDFLPIFALANAARVIAV